MPPRSFILKAKTGSVIGVTDRLHRGMSSQPVVVERIRFERHSERGDTRGQSRAVDSSTPQCSLEEDHRLTASYHDGSPGQRRSLDPQ